jgi:hypothetical protein
MASLEMHHPLMLKTEWEPLSKRIAGIVDASTFFFRCRESDAAFSTNVLTEACIDTAEAVKRLSRYRSAMAGHAIDALERFTKRWSETESLGMTGFPAVMAYTTILASFRPVLDHHFADYSTVVRSRVARAFLHLQRSLVADEAVRGKWLKAFAQEELACEKLGAVHLLSHGIYAFKASTTGGRTDLILGQNLVVDEAILAGADGLVLTEWKLVRDKNEAESKRMEAMAQTKLYTDGPIAGFELTTERYLVLVSKNEFDVTPTEQDGGTLFKTISIILAPDVPSRVARKKQRAQKSPTA